MMSTVLRCARASASSETTGLLFAVRCCAELMIISLQEEWTQWLSNCYAGFAHGSRSKRRASVR